MMSGLLPLSLGTIVSSASMAVRLPTGLSILDKLMSAMKVDTWLLNSIIS
jgi:hypothetical protein